MSLNPSGQFKLKGLSIIIITFIFFYNFHQFLKVNPGQKVQFFSISIITVFSLFFSKNLFKNHVKNVNRWI